jgi:hypothetical protein
MTDGGELAEAAPGFELTIWDKENPRSLVNIVWVDMQRVIERAKHDCRDLLILPERKLKKKVDPQPLDDMIRLRFWQEYDRAQMVGGKMMLKDIIRGICSVDYFQEHTCKDPGKLAWLILPLAGYITRMESSLYIALDEMEDILRLPILDENGIPNTKLIAEKVKLFQLLDVRVKGAVVQKLAIHQKIDQRTHHSSDPVHNLPGNDLDSLERELAKVKRQIESAQSRQLIAMPVVEADYVEIRGGDHGGETNEEVEGAEGERANGEEEEGGEEEK